MTSTLSDVNMFLMLIGEPIMKVLDQLMDIQGFSRPIDDPLRYKKRCVNSHDGAVTFERYTVLSILCETSQFTSMTYANRFLAVKRLVGSLDQERRCVELGQTIENCLVSGMDNVNDLDFLKICVHLFKTCKLNRYYNYTTSNIQKLDLNNVLKDVILSIYSEGVVPLTEEMVRSNKHKIEWSSLILDFLCATIGPVVTKNVTAFCRKNNEYIEVMCCLMVLGALCCKYKQIVDLFDSISLTLYRITKRRILYTHIVQHMPWLAPIFVVICDSYIDVMRREYGLVYDHPTVGAFAGADFVTSRLFLICSQYGDLCDVSKTSVPLYRVKKEDNTCNVFSDTVLMYMRACSNGANPELVQKNNWFNQHQSEILNKPKVHSFHHISSLISQHITTIASLKEGGFYKEIQNSIDNNPSDDALTTIPLSQ